MKILSILVAGYAWLLASGLSKRANTLEKVILTISLGIASAMLLSTVVVLARAPLSLAGTIFILLATVTLGCILSIRVGRRQSLIPSRVHVNVLRSYWLPIVLFSFHLALWILYMINYPYFPNSDPIDVVNHSEITIWVLRGIVTAPVSEIGFQTGSHILFAFISSYLGLDVLSAVRITPAVVEALSVPLTYCVFQRLLKSKLATNYSTVAFSLVIPAGLIYYTRIGAYANIVGDYFVLLSLLLVIIVSRELTVRSVLTAAFVEATALISHVGVAVFVLLVVVFSIVVYWRFRSELRAYLISNIGFILFPIAAAAAVPFWLFREFNYIAGLYFDVTAPFTLLLQQWLHNYFLFAGHLNFIFLIVALVWVLFKAERRIWSVFLSAWFGLLFLLVFVSTNDWRLVLLSMVPGVGMLGLFLTRVQESLGKVARTRVRPLKMRKFWVRFTMLAVVLILIVSGSTISIVGETLSSAQISRQHHIYESMIWLQNNSSPNSVVVSIGLLREYRYLPVIADRSYGGDFRFNSSDIQNLRTTIHFNYVVVATSFNGLATFYQSNAAKAVYENADLVIFEVLAA